MFLYHILWPLRLGWLFVLGLYKEDYLQTFRLWRFDNSAFVVNGKVCYP